MTPRLVEHFRRQAVACRELGSPLYAVLLEHVVDDVVAGGPSAQVLRGHGHERQGFALALRLMGGVHRLVLQRQAPALALHYPSVGGSGNPKAAWPAFRDVLVEHEADLRRALLNPPQTNEVGRSAVLIGGLVHMVTERPGPVRLVEIGASAGLNLRADHFRLELADGRSVGPTSSPVVLVDAWRGNAPPVRAPLDLVDRVGCDPQPVDPTTVEGRLALTSFVWPDQLTRLERLRGALAVAARVPAVVERSGAGDFLDRVELWTGTTTVVWHSVMWQYLDPAERRRIDDRLDALGAEVTADTGLARISLEPRNGDFLVRMRVWPGPERVLGTAAPHGIPVQWR